MKRYHVWWQYGGLIGDYADYGTACDKARGMCRDGKPTIVVDITTHEKVTFLGDPSRFRG